MGSRKSKETTSFIATDKIRTLKIVNQGSTLDLQNNLTIWAFNNLSKRQNPKMQKWQKMNQVNQKWFKKKLVFKLAEIKNLSSQMNNNYWSLKLRRQLVKVYLNSISSNHHQTTKPKIATLQRLWSLPIRVKDRITQVRILASSQLLRLSFNSKCKLRVTKKQRAKKSPRRNKALELKWWVSSNPQTDVAKI